MQGSRQGSGHSYSRYLRFWTEERSLSFMLFLLVLHIFILTPGGLLGRAVLLIGNLFLSLTLFAGILTLVQQPMLRRAGSLLLACAVAFRIAAIFGRSPAVVITDTVFSLFSLVALILIVLRQVSTEGPVSGHLVRGAISLYLLIAILFAFLYGLAEELVPGAFILPAALTGDGTRGEAFYYFSVVTLTTVGYGDISAVHPFARSLVMLEALIGQLYPAILIARLVTLQLETRRGAGK